MVCLSRLHNPFGMLAHLKCACAALEIDSLALEASYAPNSGAAVCKFNFFFFIFNVLRVNKCKAFTFVLEERGSVE